MSEKYRVACPVCGSESDLAVKHCGRCGADMTAEYPKDMLDRPVGARKCPQCGSDTELTTPHCNNCGASLTQGG